jgi:hypothetical protein
LNQQWQNAGTTQIKSTNENNQETDIDQGIKTQFAYAATIDAGQIYTDQTGIFPVVSSKGNTYIMILYMIMIAMPYQHNPSKIAHPLNY